MNRTTLNRNVQLVVVLLCALTLKLYYSTASVNQLRWILAPTTVFVESVSGRSFEFESYSGYMSSDHSFLIAASCAGVNFLITSFLMLSLGKLWRNRSKTIGWRFIPAAFLFAYLATLVANTVRISIALQLQQMPLKISWLSSNQLHRFEGIFIYFGFLLLLFLISEKLSSQNPSGVLTLTLFPLLIYYATMLGIPLANGAYRSGTAANDFWEHLLFVLLTPLVLILPLLTYRLIGIIYFRLANLCINSLVPQTANPTRIPSIARPTGSSSNEVRKITNGAMARAAPVEAYLTKAAGHSPLSTKVVVAARRSPESVMPRKTPKMASRDATVIRNRANSS
jgi:exosortase K